MGTVEVEYRDLRRLASAAWTFHYLMHSSPAEPGWFIKFDLCPMEQCKHWKRVIDKLGIR